MSTAPRRVILIPPDLTDAERSALRDGLSRAVAWQRELTGKSSHILQLVGSLEEIESAFYVEHEPAVPAIDVFNVFDGNAPPLEEKQLLRMAVAIADAIRAAHAGAAEKLRAHGALCPGAVLRTTDNIEKVSDFGFAQAVYAALGPDRYLNLALGPRGDGPEELIATGAWEVLSPDEFERHDRLCAFIDPESYGSGTHGAFEPGSDVIAAGFLLHMLAEHKHPYLSEPEAHLLVEMSEFMGQVRYNGARRKDLRESTDPAVKLWCDLVSSMLSRIPQNRPAAQEIITSFAPHVRPVDPAEIIRRRLDTLADLVKQRSWGELRESVKGIAENDELPTDVKDRAGELLRLANAGLLLDRAVDVLKGDDWTDAKAPLDEVLGLPALPAEVEERAKKAAAVLEHNLAARAEIQHLREKTAPDDSADAESTLRELDTVAARTDELAADKSVLPALQPEVLTFQKELAARREELAAEIARTEADRREKAERLEREIQEDHDKAQAWLEGLEVALGVEDFDELQLEIDRKPNLKHWPEKIVHRADEVEIALKAKQAEQAERAAKEKDHERAETWLASIAQAVDAEQWEQAEKNLSEKPDLAHWPDGIDARVQTLREQVEAARKKEADEATARQWLADLAAHVKAEDFGKAADTHAAKPRLDYWPDDVVTAAKRLSDLFKKQLAAKELEAREIAAWMEQAEAAAKSEQWSEALEILDEPRVPLKRAGDQVRQKAAALKKEWTAARDEQVRMLVEQRSEVVRRAAERLVHGLAANSPETGGFKTLVALDRIEVAIKDEEFDGPADYTAGSASMTLSIKGVSGDESNGTISEKFSFARTKDSLELRDRSAIEKRLADQMRDWIKKLQKQELTGFAAKLKSGVFPRVQVSVKFDGPKETAEPTICLLGTKSDKGKIATKLQWDPSALAWQAVDAEAFINQALTLAADAVRESLADRVIKQTEPLRRYEHALSLEVVPGQPGDKSMPPATLPITGKLHIQPEGADSPKLLHTFSLECAELGKLASEPDTAPAVTALNQIVVDAQKRSFDNLHNDLQRRIREAGVKVKIKANPKGIADATDRLAFELARKRLAPVSLGATWDVKAFTFGDTDAWDEQLADILAPAAPGAKGFPVVPVGIAAVLVVAGVSAAVLMNRGEPVPADPTGSTQLAQIPGGNENTNSTTGASDNTNATDNTNTTNGALAVNDTPRGNSDSAPANANQNETTEPIKAATIGDSPREQLRGLFTGELFSNHFDTLVPDTSFDPNTPTITVDIAGAAEPATKTITFVDANGDGAWTLPAGATDELRNAIDAVSNLLNQGNGGGRIDSARGEFLEPAANQLAAGLLDATKLQIAWPTPPASAWQLVGEPGARFWQAADAPLEIRYELPADVATEPRGLGTFAATLEVVGGAIRIAPDTPDVDAAIFATVRSGLLTVQQNSAQEREDELDNAIGDASQLAAEFDLEFPDGPRTELTWSIEPQQQMAKWAFRAPWNATNLRFEFGSTDLQRAETLQPAMAFVTNFNNRPNPENDWLGSVTQNPLRELFAPEDNGDWALGVTAPWADATSTSLEKTLPVVVNTSLLSEGDPVAAFLEQSPPDYWGLLKRQAEIAADPAFVTASDVIQRFAEDLGKAHGPGVDAEPLTAYLLSNDALIVPKLSAVGKSEVLEDRNGDALPDALTLTFTGAWALRNPPDGVGVDAVNQGLGTLVQGTEISLQLGVDGGGNVSMTWISPGALSDEMAASLPRVAALEQQIASLARRKPVEDALNQVLTERADQSGRTVDLSSDRQKALELLRLIWDAKEIDNPQLASIADIVGKARQNRGGVDRKKGEPVKTLGPTIFIEYFCGPYWCYGMVWSAASTTNTLVEGPFLQQLVATGKLAEAAPDLGDRLLGDLLAHVPKAVAAGGVRKTDFSNSIGILIGIDEALGLIDLPTLRVSSDSKSFLEPLDPTSRDGPGIHSWQTLADFDTDPLTRYFSAYWLVDGLAKWTELTPHADDPAHRDATAWAVSVLSSAP